MVGCSHPGCGTAAIGATKRCKAHGGGKLQCGSPVYVWGHLDDQWVKCVGTILETHDGGSEHTVAFDPVGEAKAVEVRIHGSSLHAIGTESAPPCATAKRKREEGKGNVKWDTV